MTRTHTQIASPESSNAASTSPTVTRLPKATAREPMHHECARESAVSVPRGGGAGRRSPGRRQMRRHAWMDAGDAGAAHRHADRRTRARRQPQGIRRGTVGCGPSGRGATPVALRRGPARRASPGAPERPDSPGRARPRSGGILPSQPRPDATCRSTTPALPGPHRPLARRGAPRLGGGAHAIRSVRSQGHSGRRRRWRGSRSHWSAWGL